MALAFEQYGHEYTSTVKKSVEIDKELMAKAYMEMAEINLEEAQAGETTLTDGMKFYGGEW